MELLSRRTILQSAGASGSPHTPLPHPRNWKRQLPLQSQLRGSKEKTKGQANIDQNVTADT